MSGKPFQIDRFGESGAKTPDDVLRPIASVERRSVARQLIDNLRVKFSLKPRGWKTPDAGIEISSRAEL